MATTMNDPLAAAPAAPTTTTRKSLPLTSQDVLDIAKLRRQHSSLGQSLAELAGVNPQDSEAAVLHGLFYIGLQSVKAAAEERGYAQIAASYGGSDTDEAARAAGSRARRDRGARERSLDA